MNPATQHNQTLQRLISAGATLTVVGGTGAGPARTVGLAAAKFITDEIDQPQLWYCDLWPENDFAQHWIIYDDVQENKAPGMLAVWNDGQLVAVIAPMEESERRDMQWDRWAAQKDDEAVECKRFADALAWEVGR